MFKTSSIHIQNWPVGYGNRIQEPDASPTFQVDALGKKLQTNLEAGLSGADDDIRRRQDVYGSNTFPEKPSRSLLVRASILIHKTCFRCHFAPCESGTHYYKRGSHDNRNLAYLGRGLLPFFHTYRLPIYRRTLSCQMPTKNEMVLVLFAASTSGSRGIRSNTSWSGTTKNVFGYSFHVCYS